MNYELDKSSILTSLNKVHINHTISYQYTNSVHILDSFVIYLKHFCVSLDLTLTMCKNKTKIHIIDSQQYWVLGATGYTFYMV